MGEVYAHGNIHTLLLPPTVTYISQINYYTYHVRGMPWCTTGGIAYIASQ